MKKLVHVKSLITLALCLMMCFTFFAPASTVQAKKRVVDNVFMYPTDPYSYPTCTGWVPCKKIFTSSKKASKTYVRETAWKVIDTAYLYKAATSRGKVFYTKSHHVGIVEYVENGIVHTIEGNKNNQVMRGHYELTYKGIMGYGTPDYPDEGLTSSTASEILSKAQEIGKMMVEEKWVYSNTDLKGSLAAAEQSAKRTNCAHGVCLVLQEVGLLKKGQIFFGNKSGELSCNGTVRKQIEKGFDIIKTGGKKSKDLDLKPGDICLFKGHAKYEGKQKGRIEQQIEAAEHNAMRQESSTAYLRYINDPSYIPVSIDKRTLVEKSNVINKDGLERYNQFSCRIPGTYGKNEKQLVIPNEQVFEKQNGSYIAFLQKDESPFVFDVITKQVDHEMRKLTGEEFVKRYFDKVDKTVERKVTSLQKYKENTKAKDLSDLKIKMPTPPIKSK